ncbi:unnamed protein product [Gadus morhua 'NCC']
MEENEAKEQHALGVSITLPLFSFTNALLSIALPSTPSHPLTPSASHPHTPSASHPHTPSASHPHTPSASHPHTPSASLLPDLPARGDHALGDSDGTPAFRALLSRERYQ